MCVIFCVHYKWKWTGITYPKRSTCLWIASGKTMVWAQNLTFWGRRTSFFFLLATVSKTISLMSCTSQNMHASIQGLVTAGTISSNAIWCSRTLLIHKPLHPKPFCLLEFSQQGCNLFKPSTLWHLGPRPGTNKGMPELVSHFQSATQRGLCYARVAVFCLMELNLCPFTSWAGGTW